MNINASDLRDAFRMIARGISISLPALIAALLLTSYSAAGDNPPDMERIISRGKIIVAMHSEDTPPFFMHDKRGDFNGFDVEMARDIAGKLEVELEFNRDANSFDEVVELVNSKKADVAISMLSNTLRRARSVKFTESYITLKRMLLINRLMLAGRGKDDSDPLEAFNNPETGIGVITGTSYVAFVSEDFPKARIIQYNDWDSLINSVLNGKIMALFYDDLEIKNWIRSNPENALYLQTSVMENKKDHLSLAVHWKDTHLLSWLNNYLRAFTEGDLYDRLVQKYIESEEWRDR